MTESSEKIREIMETAIQNIRDIADVNTVVGEPITTTDGTTVIPVSKVSVGFASGGSDFATKEQAVRDRKSFGGGSGAGVTVTPVSFLVITPSGGVNILPVTQESSVGNKILELVPDIVDSIKKYIEEKKMRNGR